MPSVPASVSLAYSDIQAILARNDLTDEQKSVLIDQRCTQACGDQFTFNFNTSKTVNLVDPSGVHWRISATGLAYTVATRLFELFGVVVLREGVDVGLDPHQQIVNPPLLYPDPSGTITYFGKKYRVDPAAVILDMLIEYGSS